MNFTRRTVLHALAASIGTFHSGAEPTATKPRFESLVEEIRKKHDLPALAAAVVGKSGVREMATCGNRRRGTDSPALATDTWHIGSLTKSMTAVLLAIAVEKGLLDWEDSLQKHFPQSHPSHHATTLREMLEHRGGFDHSGPEAVWKAVGKQPGSPREQRAWWVPKALAEARPRPHGAVSYSNFGAVIIGHLLEKCYDQSWETLLIDQLAKPLGLDFLGFGPTAISAQKDDGIWGHSPEGKPIPPGPKADNPAALGPAGTVHMRLAELARYAQWHMSEGQDELGKVGPQLTPDSWKILHTSRMPANQPGGQPAAGWFTASRPWAKGECYTHTGSNVMNYAIVWVAPKANLCLISACNQGGDAASKGCDEILSRIISTGTEK